MIVDEMNISEMKFISFLEVCSSFDDDPNQAPTQHLPRTVPPPQTSGQHKNVVRHVRFRRFSKRKNVRHKVKHETIRLGFTIKTFI